MDRRAVRLALGLTVAGALMLTAGVATWLITTLGRVTSGMAASDLRLASLALLAGGAACGVGMGFALASAGHPWPAASRSCPGAPGSLPAPRSLPDRPRPWLRPSLWLRPGP